MYKGNLTVTVHEARGLPHGNYKAFLSFKLGTIQQLTSQIVSNGAPTWNATFAHVLTGTEEDIEIVVNIDKAAKPVAFARLQLSQLLDKHTKDRVWYTISSNPPGGEICLSTTYVEATANSVGGVLSAHDAASAPPGYDEKSISPNSMTTDEQKMKITQSTCYGPCGVHDSVEFCDVATNIQRVVVYNDGKNIYGLQVVSRSGAERCRHQKIQEAFGYSVLELGDDEYITEVKGGEDDAGIVFLEFFTNKGTKKHYGGKADGYVSPFNVYIPMGNVVVGFKGAYGRKMHNVGVLSAGGYS